MACNVLASAPSRQVRTLSKQLTRHGSASRSNNLPSGGPPWGRSANAGYADSRIIRLSIATNPFIRVSFGVDGSWPDARGGALRVRLYHVDAGESSNGMWRNYGATVETLCNGVQSVTGVPLRTCTRAHTPSESFPA